MNIIDEHFENSTTYSLTTNTIFDWEIKKIKINGWRRNFGFKIIEGKYESNRMRIFFLTIIFHKKVYITSLFFSTVGLSNGMKINDWDLLTWLTSSPPAWFSRLLWSHFWVTLLTHLWVWRDRGANSHGRKVTAAVVFLFFGWPHGDVLAGAMGVG